jgi:hypothetical protein
VFRRALGAAMKELLRDGTLDEPLAAARAGRCDLASVDESPDCFRRELRQVRQFPSGQ